MMSTNDRSRSLLCAAGAVVAAAGVALSAYAAHGAEDAARASLQSAALFALLHGVALTTLPRQTTRRLGFIALGILLLGVVLFSGSLVAGYAFGTTTRLAPFGGSLLIFAWLLYAADALRR